MMALVGLTASAQFSPKPSAVQKTNAKALNVPQTQRSFQAVAPLQGLPMKGYAPSGSKLTLDLAKVKPVTRAQRALISAQSMMQNQAKAFAKGMVQHHKMVNLQPTMTLNPQTSAQAQSPRKAPAFAESYMARGIDYFTKEYTDWTMTPTTATYKNKETGVEEEAEVLVDVIPTPDFLAEIYPDGIPMKYTVDENVITILPQAIASYEDEENGTTNYITLFSVNSDDEDGIINIEVNDNGKLTITNGNWICFGEFADVAFDEDMSDSEAYLGIDELIVNINYYYHMETTIDQEYSGHGVDYFASEAVDWVMKRGTVAIDDEETHFFVDMTPLTQTFAGIYPDGIDVEYEQEGSTIIVKPQVIASLAGDEETEAEYVLIFSGESDNGVIELTEGENGALTISNGASIIIGAWGTDKFDPTFETYKGSYSYIENIKYRLPDAPAEAPEDVACEPNELVLFAGLGYSGYAYNDNLAVMGAYAPTTFRNLTLDLATDFEWSALESDDDADTPLTGNGKTFTINTKGGAVYEDFKLTAYNQDAVSEPYTWGYGHCLTDDGTSPRYEAIHAYAGRGASFFNFTDGTYATMTRQNPDYDLTFYVNWATPDIAANYNSASISTIYSYQGKPATPLFLTGVTLPLVSFEAQEDFNLHIKLYKCSRSASGNLTLGEVIAEGDATTANVNADYDAGLTAVEFTELYTEDEFGMSEVLDYLFIDDEFVIVIEGWDNGTFSGVLGSHEYNFNENTSTWFQATGEQRMRSYGGGWPQLFIGLLDATYGYLHTEDNTNLQFGTEGGQTTIHIDPMYYSIDEETSEPSYSLVLESVTADGEEAEEIPEWLTIEIANEDYTTATETDDEGNEYTYFVNGIDYDMVITAEALPAGVESRDVEVTFFQTGARLTVKVSQAEGQGISTNVTRTPIKNSRIYNVAGQSVKAAKGIVVRDGKKYIAK